MKSKGNGMTRSINWKLLVLIPLSTILAGCSGMISKYGMNSFKRFKVSKDGHYLIPATMSASGPYSEINFEGVAKISNIKVDSRIFQDSSFLPYVRDVEAYFDSGADSAIVFYRNYVTFCCDSHSVGTFLVFLGYHQGEFEPTRSFITEAGSIEPPHYTWWPRKIVAKESSLYIEAYQSPRDTVKPFWFEIFHKGETETGLENFTKSKRGLRKLINENEMLIKN